MAAVDSFDSADDDYDSESSASSYDGEQARGSAPAEPAGPSASGALPPRVPPLALNAPQGGGKATPRVPLLGLRLPLARDSPPGGTPRPPGKPEGKADTALASARKSSSDGSMGEALPPKPPRLNLGSVAGEPSPSPKRTASGRSRDGALTISLLSEAFQVSPLSLALSSEREKVYYFW